MSSLGPTFGRGAMTNPWTDIRATDLAIIMGGNAAEAHPCGFKWVTHAKEHRGAKLIVVDPRFTRSASVADFYAPIRQGSDIAFLSGVINYCISHDKVQFDYVKHFTNAGLIVNEGFEFKDGLFTGMMKQNAIMIVQHGLTKLVRTAMLCLTKHCSIHVVYGSF